ncbi:MAG TPA: 23S rRNA (adenine(2503)-C(2))-methyltransferase RlmN [Bacteroidales bacterium]|nr:23S rRNA (adenine(2503)-C(2))-methyltransferase RlmN [Bacteroidales bacterium]NLZ09306.1 23S rRNA (adenine(2503)-C(2))-methyltransferase RlmN [Bacteroidales bacterium]HOF75164.1 23S rRNA (adenine(2503)-C(2))-methyltransferase RlmN [Bacteroidales bacterium]HOQ96312.1 23S rRNA (adenine(2503)-C(2))-methyltransferase RlmN [Bacteroidales bacterium]HPL84421.1 23S rRNA (adenine(2503)-C(2))-methyltransferase RlmN [Bacteroidales bacterium]
MKEWLLGKNPEQLRQIAASYGLPAFAAGQIANWIYARHVREIADMTNLSRAAREKLAETYQVGGFEPLQVQVSTDGTKKYLFPTLCVSRTGVEAVMIPEGDRATLCLSSQVGCKLGCSFCMTGRMGFAGNLTAGEIVGQFLGTGETDRLTNIVYMGMGEPLDNWDQVLRSLEIFTADWGFALSPRRITVSTSGILPVLDDFMAKTQAHLAISLHSPYDEQRAQIMPVQKAFPISSVVQKLRQYDFSGQRRLSFEYILFDGWNDTLRHAAALLQLLRGLECRVNLIRFHAIEGFPMRPSAEPAVNAFMTRLNRAGLVATVRASRGEDILAACGQLSVKKNEK